MYRVSNFTDNDDVKTLDQKGPFTVIEYQRDPERDAGFGCHGFLLCSDERKKAAGHM